MPQNPISTGILCGWLRNEHTFMYLVESEFLYYPYIRIICHVGTHQRTRYATQGQ